MKFYNYSAEEVLSKLNSSMNGLSTSESIERLKKYGKNKISTGKKQSLLSKFVNEFRNLMIIVLILAAIVSFIISIVNNESFTDSIIIIAIVILNAILGFVQELKADKAIDELKNMQVTKVKVKRDKKIYVVNSEDIVIGDILVLEAGDTIPADARIICDASLKVDEASLTGESIAVEKNSKVIVEDVELHDRRNMIFSGTNIVYGKCQAVVCGTGMDTEFGKIADSLNQETKEVTPLQKKIDGISKFLSLIIAIIILIMFFVGIIQKMDFLEIFMLSISLAVAAIPEGLPTVITITLSIGIKTLANKKAIVRKMSSVETLGCTEIICSDKTGTITQNKMTVREIYYNNEITKIEEIDKDNMLFKNMILNNDVEKNNDEYIGEATEIALYEALDNYIDIKNIRNCNKRIGELPFDSERKMMSVITENKNDITMYTKGSFDSIIDRCSYILENNQINILDDVIRNRLKQVEKEESNKAYRILAYAYRILDDFYDMDNSLENDLIFIGMTAMIDPPRIDVKKAIADCKMAHIKPVMITGDSLDTAKAIAKEIGILEKDDEAILGSSLDKLTLEEQQEFVKKYSVYARVSPINKLAIVNAWKANGKIVAMTGDGVNDAPALKAANIGVGMGITGTEVSKSVSDIVLADDSFSTIVSAVKEGRRIFDNIRNVLVYLLSSNMAEVLVVFIGMLFGLEIFLPIQLLYINLITDSIPAISLAFEKEEEDIMKRKVRKNDRSFFTPFLTAKLGIGAVLKAIAILIVYQINYKYFDVNVANTMAFLTLILLETIYAFNCKNLKKSILNKNIFSNKVLNISMIILGIIQVLVFISPIKELFNLVSISIYQLLFSLFVTICVFLIVEFSKGFINKKFKDE